MEYISKGLIFFIFCVLFMFVDMFLLFGGRISYFVVDFFLRMVEGIMYGCFEEVMYFVWVNFWCGLEFIFMSELLEEWDDIED